MDTKPEVCVVNYKQTKISSRKHAIPIISISLGGLLGLALFLYAMSVDTSSIILQQQPTTEVDAVAVCKEGIIKYAPLGAYPGGQVQVKAAFAYCNSLG